jgi:hypothetical protein
MKATALTLFVLSFFMLCFSSCSERPEPASPSFNYASGAGMWIIEEIENDNGEIFRESLKSMNIFGAYNGSVLLNEDKTYVPVNFDPSDNSYPLEPIEAGTYEYFQATQEIEFTGQFFSRRFYVRHFDGDILHLYGDGATYKFWRKS